MARQEQYNDRRKVALFVGFHLSIPAPSIDRVLQCVAGACGNQASEEHATTGSTSSADPPPSLLSRLHFTDPLKMQRSDRTLSGSVGSPNQHPAPIRSSQLRRAFLLRQTSPFLIPPTSFKAM
jgi:hypothetical protein